MSMFKVLSASLKIKGDINKYPFVSHTWAGLVERKIKDKICFLYHSSSPGPNSLGLSFMPTHQSSQLFKNNVLIRWLSAIIVRTQQDYGILKITQEPFQLT